VRYLTGIVLLCVGFAVCDSAQAASFSVALALSPNSISPTLTTGSKANQTIRLVNPNTNSALNNIGANIQSNQNWCTVSGFDGSSFKVTVDASALPPGPAYATVTVQYNGNGSPFVAVSLAVSATVAPPATAVAGPSPLSFPAFRGGPNPAQQAVSLAAGDGSTHGFPVTATPSLVSVSPGSEAPACSGKPAQITRVGRAAGWTSTGLRFPLV